MLKESIKKHEGFRAKPYPDPIYGWDVPTFGIGFTYLTEEEADYILGNRIDSITKELIARSDVFVLMPDGIKDVLIEMAFQLGVNGVMKFKNMWAALAVSDYELAAKEMLDSRWARQTPGRAKELAERVEHGR